MRVIILSWEYPPRIVGQLANYVKKLAGQLVKNKVEVYVITYHDFLTGEHDDSDGTKVIRVTNPVRTHIGVLTWVLTLNQEVERATANVYYEVGRRVDLIDIHDWHFIPAALTINKAMKIPFVYSVESLEEHRSHGANSPFNMAIKSIERLGMYEAKNLVVKSEWMRNEIIKLHGVPTEKIKIILQDSASWIEDILSTYNDAVEAEVAR